MGEDGDEMLFRLILLTVIGAMLYRFLRGIALMQRKRRAQGPPRRPPAQPGFDFEEGEVTDVSYSDYEHKGNES